MADNHDMEIVRVSGSSMDRVARCEASAALPQVIDGNENDGQKRGHAVHDFLERVPDVGREVALAEVPEKWRELCADIQLAKLAPQLKLSREVTLVYNWRDDTARMPPQDMHVKVDRRCESVVRLDLLGLGERRVYVGDYKTGHGWLPTPERSYQLGMGAVAAARFFGARSATLEYIRIRDDGTIRKHSGEQDLFALDDTADKIKRTMLRAMELRERVLGGFVPNVVEGPWCKYCPAKFHCPAKTAGMRHVIGDPSPVPYVIPLTPEIALTAYLKLKEAKERLGMIESAIYAYAKLTPIPLGEDEDGSRRFFGELTRDGNDQLDGKIAHEVIASYFGGEVANQVVTMETTKKAITEAVKKHKQPDQTQKEVFEAIIDEIDLKHGISNPLTTSTIEYSISPDGDAKVRRPRKAG
jgi:hypothetical protein